MITLRLPLRVRQAVPPLLGFPIGVLTSMVFGPLGIGWSWILLTALIVATPLVVYTYRWRRGLTDRLFTRPVAGDP